MSGVPVSHSMPTLLERETPLTTLREAFGDALTGRGRLVLLGGEAGVGKTALLRAFCEEVRQRARILVGACDPLVTPRPLGPIVDVAAETGGELERRTSEESGASAVLAALMDELRGRPTVLVMEDLHWADEATLDLLRLLGRRVEGTRSVIVASFRDDELDTQHPLRLVLGGLATGHAVTRIHLEPLSLPAVRVLAVLRDVDADELHRRTGGNPFFVTEVLAAGDQIPVTVRDAVLARAARLSGSARRLLDAVAVNPARAELWLLEQVSPGELPSLDECLAAGMLVEREAAVRFRHELARLAVEGAIPGRRRRELHTTILGALESATIGSSDPARLTHHSTAADAADAVLTYAPVAAKRAAAAGSHREAAALYSAALSFGRGFPPAIRADLLSRKARELELTDQIDDAIDATTQALELWRSLGDRLREGDELRFLSRLYGMAGRHDEKSEAATQAIAVLEPLGTTREIGFAYLRMASMHAMELELETADVWSRRAFRVAEELGDERIRLSGRYYRLQPSTAYLLETLDLARQHGTDADVAKAYEMLAFTCTRRREWSAADQAFGEGIPFAVARDLDGSRLYLLAWRGVADLHRARWDAAASDAAAVLTEARLAVTRATAAMVSAQVRARRGDPGAWDSAAEAALIVRQATNSAQKQTAVAATRAEVAVLAGTPELAVAEPWEAPLAQLVDRWVAGFIAVWRHRGGVLAENPGLLPEPYALELAGEHAAAADYWRRVDCRFDAAAAAAWSGDGQLERAAHDELVEIGALGAARVVARRLRSGGARGLAHGPRRATAANPAGLTRREVEVLRLLGEGLRNASIAQQLSLSTRTVDHHVSAILRKLDAASRGEAVAAAGRLGLLQDR